MIDTGQTHRAALEHNTHERSVRGSDDMKRMYRRMAALGLAILLSLGLCSAAAATSGTQDDWAIYLYLCGTDLETRSGAASADLMEIVRQKMPDNVTVVIQTGGAKQWQNNIVDADYSERYALRGDQFLRVWRGERKSMGDAGTLAEFLGFCHDNFPAKHEAVIIWDHGGGSAGGLVIDEQFGNDRLSLGELHAAFDRVFTENVHSAALDLVGFDCCLMATVDTAAAISGYARYMVASEETVPGCGWNYYGLLALMRRYPGMDGEMMGKAICETYMAGCRAAGLDGEVTMSVTDLTKIEPLLTAYNRFGSQAVLAACDDSSFFAAFGRGAKAAENYGGNTPKTGYTNMVDLGDLARQNASLMPSASRAVINALEDCVVYKVNGAYRSHASGLSCYYAYDPSQKLYNLYASVSASESFKVFYDYMLTGRLDQEARAYLMEDLGYSDSIEEHETLNDFSSRGWQTTIDDEGYAVLTLNEETLATVSDVTFQLAYLDEESDMMLFLGSDNDIEQDWERGVFKDNFRGVWGCIDGCLCHMEIIYQSSDYNLYNVPVLLNGMPSQLKVAYDYDEEEYYILGAQRGLDDYGMADRDMARLRVGDVITTLHKAATTSGEDEFEWYEFDTLVVNRNTSFGEMDLGDGTFALLFTLTDGRGETTYADEVLITVEGDDMYFEVV